MPVITNEIIELHDRMMGTFFAEAKHAYEQSFAESGQAINDKVLLFAEVGAALIVAKDAGTDP